MGYGSYKASDWAKLKESKGISNVSSAAEIFRDNNFQEKYDPFFITARESRDSEDSPNSTPIILGFDVTGSMGFLAAEIAKNSLNKTILEIYDKNLVSNPHVMCAAITQPINKSGLQVTQFEADIRVIEQLLELKVRFGGNTFSYDSLVWYFAAKHTEIDSYKKRGKKGFIFVIGDEICGADKGESLSVLQIKNVYNDETDHDLPLTEVYNMAAEKYEIFHITVHERAINSWNSFLPGRCAYISEENIQYLSEVITSIIQITNGMSKKDVLKQWSGKASDVVQTAISDINIKKASQTQPQNYTQKYIQTHLQADKKTTADQPLKKNLILKLFLQNY
ncbi:MAG: hypothetical protein IJO14_05715 [Clostridia bacterium]|nr:hypothetical protein [Clostridia bacterium]